MTGIAIAVTAVVLAAAPAASAQCAGSLPTLPGDWCSVDGPHVRVWWESSSTDHDTAIVLRDYIEAQLWPLYAKVLGRQPLPDPIGTFGRVGLRWFGEDARYDIVLDSRASTLSHSPLVPTALAGAPPARYSVLATRLPLKKLRAAAAHQLMRGFLTAFGCYLPCWWLEEATATWAEHLAAPTANTEHAYAADFLRSPRLSLHHDPDDPNDPVDLRSPDRHKSGAYLFLLFVQYDVARNVTFIRQLWDAAESTGNPLTSLEAVLARQGGFAQVWRRFIAANWSAQLVLQPGSEAVFSYGASDRLTTSVQRLKAFTDYTGARKLELRSPMATSLEKPLAVTLPPLSAAYFAFDFDLSVRSVRLIHNLKQLRARGADLAVFTRRTGEEWKLEPRWANENSRQYCRDLAADSVDQMVVILGNASTTSTITFSGARLVAGNAPCLSDPDAGYEECWLEFPRGVKVYSNGVVETYQNLEIQRWRITGAPTVAGNSVTYPYAWTTTGAGASTRTADDTFSNAAWTIAGDGSGTLRFSFGQIGGQAVRAVTRLATGTEPVRIRVVGGIVGEDRVRTAGTSQDHTTTFREDAFEFLRPRSAPVADPSFSGFAQSTLDASWAPGRYDSPTQEPDYQGTIACRWHWPRKP